MPASGLLDVVRPFLWLALAAFVAGFLGYVAWAGRGLRRGRPRPLRR